jgi:type II secretion system protein N
MTGWKKHLALAAGYSAFFVCFFFFSFYLSFNPDFLAGPLAKALQSSWGPLKDKKITIDQVARHRLFGLDLRGIKIASSAGPGPEATAPTFVIERCILHPRVLSLPGLFSALKEQRPPAINLSSFSLHLADGRIKGALRTSPRVFFLEADIKDALHLDKLRLPSARFKDTKLDGILDGTMTFDYRDLKDPATWKGELKLELDKLGLKNLSLLEDLEMDKGTLIAKIKGAKIIIETLKLQGDDLPMNLQGTIELRNPFPQSFLEIKGPLEQGEDFKAKNALAASFLPNNRNFTYNGTIDALFPGVF